MRRPSIALGHTPGCVGERQLSPGQDICSHCGQERWPLRGPRCPVAVQPHGFSLGLVSELPDFHWIAVDRQFILSNPGRPGATSHLGRPWTYPGRDYGDEVAETLPADVALVLDAVLGEDDPVHLAPRSAGAAHPRARPLHVWL